MPTFLLVAKHAELDQHNAQLMVKIALETSTSEDIVRSPGATAGGDPRKLRGIPAIGPNCPGAIPGTAPHHTVR